MKRILVIGRAQGVWEEVAAARQLATFDEFVLINGAGCDWPEVLHHWVTFHVHLMRERWVPLRHKNGYSPALNYWTAVYKKNPVGRKHERQHNFPLRRVVCEGGSSGLIGTMVGLDQGDLVVLAGIPMNADAGHYDQAGPWKEASKYHQAWEAVLPLLKDRVRSMSGWTRDLLGEPTAEWLINAPESNSGD